HTTGNLTEANSPSIADARCCCCYLQHLIHPNRQSVPSTAADRGKKARVPERSEFRAAPIREERREPRRLHRIGMRPTEAVLVPFAATKGTRLLSRRKLLTLIHPPLRAK